MDTLLYLTQLASAVTGISAAVLLLIKPARDWLTGAGDLREGMRCSLRNDMLHTYYKHREDKTIRQYELENFIRSYKAYKRLKGNSFVDRIYKEVLTWEVLT